MTGPLNMNDHKVTGFAEGSAGYSDGVNIGQLRETPISSFSMVNIRSM